MTPELSIVIPTYNRRAFLVRTLEALARQTLEHASYEILVIDDGSSDGTWEMLTQAKGVRTFRQGQNAGPAAARNVGILNARGKWILFLGDDTYPTPECLQAHLQGHLEHPGDHVAVLGNVEWWKGATVTPLMRYLTTGGTIQHFSFHAIQDHENVPYGFFFTANISVSRAFLVQYGMFDPDFRFAYGEDTELAYRLSKHGLRIVFRQEARVDHDHPTTYADAKRRAQNAGKTEVIMARKHPELVNLSFLAHPANTRARIRARRMWTRLVIDPFLGYADGQRWDHPRLRKLFDETLGHHQLWSTLDTRTKGAQRADTTASPVSPNGLK